MTFVIAFARFWYDFIVGDDWTIAAAIIVALLLTRLLVLGHITAWWLLPAVVLGFLWWSVSRVARS